ncbi:MAG: hypothetical protein C4520_09145 [Candidatus Abyssobacteria bacterium SURF_5]|uniref:Nucleoside phosphorylase domain-containing protein n=1 Tax=Abyssobacteria bacterium (strain SURF_5) TaxID=2093360 RepID=A0A3A4NS04_ABYX5|nr:MAG: hypothetical protein C4520_09145 [Candidatus Abyssubacteria bacterium SURF_5]
MYDPIAVTAAMEREVGFLRSALVPANSARKKIVSGAFGGKNVYLLRTGIGPLKTVQRLGELEQLCTPQCVISIGCAGALDSSLRIGDIIVSEALHDDVSSGSLWKTAPALVDVAIKSCEKLKVPYRVGNTVTTNAVAATPPEKRRLCQKYGALAVDMESAQVASWAARLQIPMLSVRSISDLADDTLPPELAGMYDKDGKLRIAQAFSLAGKPSLFLTAFRLKAQFDRSVSALARIMLPILQEI